MVKEEIQLTSFQVIGFAGDAFDQFVRAINAAKDYDFDKANEFLEKGTAALNQAHKAQTNLLSSEVNGAEIPFSILLVHAQDHLMHAMTYQQTAKDIIDLYKEMGKRGDVKKKE